MQPGSTRGRRWLVVVNAVATPRERGERLTFRAAGPRGSPPRKGGFAVEEASVSLVGSCKLVALLGDRFFSSHIFVLDFRSRFFFFRFFFYPPPVFLSNFFLSDFGPQRFGRFVDPCCMTRR